MAMNSINTNVGAMIALQNLNGTNSQLATTQSRINTGLKVANAKDNGAIWAIAQNQRSNVGALETVTDSLNRGKSTLDVAISAGETISDLLNQMKAKALAAADVSLDSVARAAMNDDFKALRDQIKKTVSSASFNGTNLLNTSAVNLYSLADATGTSKLTAQAQIMGLGVAGGILQTVTPTASFSTQATASAMVATLNAAITGVNAAVAKMGTASKAYDLHTAFVGKLMDTMTAGIGNLVDADVAKESATLQALQTKQQLGIQALSIANQSPQAILSLFR
ncbi:MAG: flagellin [Caulobacterales bacterium 32-69-10]|nr:MAG: flagellin [Caulobacterales bacterium 32-69-10]